MGFKLYDGSTPHASETWMLGTGLSVDYDTDGLPRLSAAGTGGEPTAGYVQVADDDTAPTLASRLVFPGAVVTVDPATDYATFNFDSRYRLATESIPWSAIGGTKPTTLNGYGITDAYTRTQLQTPGGASFAAENLTGEVADGRLSSNIPRLNVANVFTQDQTLLSANLQIRGVTTGGWARGVTFINGQGAIMGGLGMYGAGDGGTLRSYWTLGTGSLHASTAGIVMEPDATYGSLVGINRLNPRYSLDVTGEVAASGGFLGTLNAAWITGELPAEHGGFGINLLNVTTRNLYYWDGITDTWMAIPFPADSAEQRYLRLQNGNLSFIGLSNAIPTGGLAGQILQNTGASGSAGWGPIFPTATGGEIGTPLVYLGLSGGSPVYGVADVAGPRIPWGYIDSPATFAPSSHSHSFASLTSKPTTISGYGITDAVPTSRTITAGTGLLGGGSLAANRTISLDVVSPALGGFGMSFASLGAALPWWNGTAFQTVTVNAESSQRYLVKTTSGTLAWGTVSGTITAAGTTAGQVLQSTGSGAQSYTWGPIFPTAGAEIGAPLVYRGLTGGLQTFGYADVVGPRIPWGYIDSPATFAPASHTHPWSQITGEPVYTTRWPTASEVGAQPASAALDQIATSGSYGSIRVSGLSNDYAGIQFNSTAADWTFMVRNDETGRSGLYHQSSPVGWSWLWENGVLQTGTVPWGNVGSKPTTLTGYGIAGGRFTGGFYQQSTDVMWGRPIASYEGPSSVTGAVVVRTSMGRSENTMFTVKIGLFEYNTLGSTHFTVSGYAYSSPVNISFTAIGSRRAMNVRVAYDSTDRLCIIIGDTGDTWPYPKVWVEDAMLSYSGLTADDYDDWSATVTSSLTGYTNISSCANRSVVADADTVAGNFVNQNLRTSDFVAFAGASFSAPVGINGSRNPSYPLTVYLNDGQRVLLDYGAIGSLNLVKYATGTQDYADSMGLFASGGKDLLLMTQTAAIRFITGTTNYTETMRLAADGTLTLRTGDLDLSGSQYIRRAGSAHIRFLLDTTHFYQHVKVTGELWAGATGTGTLQTRYVKSSGGYLDISATDATYNNGIILRRSIAVTGDWSNIGMTDSSTLFVGVNSYTVGFRVASTGSIYADGDVLAPYPGHGNYARIGQYPSNADYVGIRRNSDTYPMIMSNGTVTYVAAPDVAGTIYFRRAGNVIATMNSAGLTVAGTVNATSYFTSSSRKVKHDIQPWENEYSLDLLRRVNVVRFRYNERPQEQEVGFIAEEVDPLLVSMDRCYMKLATVSGVLIGAVKKIDNRVTRLERENEELHRRLAALRN